MELLFLSIQKQLSDNLPEMALIDEDYGQLNLDSEEDTYPVVFPCLLISVREVADWKNLAGASQRGEVTIDIKLAIDCYEDTHYIPAMPDELKARFASKAAERIQLCNKVHKTLQNFSGKIIQDENGAALDGYFSPLKRTASVFYSMPHKIKVYQQTYKTTIMDIIG